jgi:hypothetical protein
VFTINIISLEESTHTTTPFKNAHLCR